MDDLAADDDRRVDVSRPLSEKITAFGTLHT